MVPLTRHLKVALGDLGQATGAARHGDTLPAVGRSHERIALWGSGQAPSWHLLGAFLRGRPFFMGCTAE